MNADDEKTASDAPLLHYEQVGFRATAGEPFLFQSLDFSLRPGERILLTGPVSCGKSSALKLALGTLAPTTGRVRLWDRDPATLSRTKLNVLRRRLGYVPSRGELLSNLTLYENLVLPLRYHRTYSEKDVRRKAADALAWFGAGQLPSVMAPLTDRRLQRKVALARALILDPAFLLLDDPTHGFSEAVARELWNCLADACDARNLAVLATAQDHESARGLEARVIKLSSEWSGDMASEPAAGAQNRAESSR